MFSLRDQGYRSHVPDDVTTAVPVPREQQPCTAMAATRRRAARPGVGPGRGGGALRCPLSPRHPAAGLPGAPRRQQHAGRPRGAAAPRALGSRPWAPAPFSHGAPHCQAGVPAAALPRTQPRTTLPPRVGPSGTCLGTALTATSTTHRSCPPKEVAMAGPQLCHGQPGRRDMGKGTVCRIPAF